MEKAKECQFFEPLKRGITKKEFNFRHKFKTGDCVLVDFVALCIITSKHVSVSVRVCVCVRCVCVCVCVCVCMCGKSQP